MVYLSSGAPDYRQPIQTVGFSTGNLPAMEVAWYITRLTRTPAMAVNRVSLLDAVCSNLSLRVAHSTPTPSPGSSAGSIIISATIRPHPSAYTARRIHIVCNRLAPMNTRSKNTPLQAWIIPMGSHRIWLSVPHWQRKELSAQYCLSKYYFVINAAQSLVLFNQSLYPGKILAPVKLTGPADGTRSITVHDI